MKIVVFNGRHKLDLHHEIIYFDRFDLQNVDEIIEQIKLFKPDLIWEEEKNDGVSVFTDIYKQFPDIPKAWWLIDGHCNLIDHIVYAKQFDYVFCAQSWFVPIVQREVKAKVFYLPLCHTQTMTGYQKMLQTPVKKDIYFSFIGNIRSIHVERREYISKFLAIYPNFFAVQSDYEATLQYLRRSKATFNCSLNNDLNFRVWEALACDTVLITDGVTDIGSIKGLRDRVVTYDKLFPDWTTDMPRDKDRVGFIKQGHTLTHRMLQMLDMVQLGEQYGY